MDDTEIIDKTSISADQIEETHSQFQQTQLADRTEYYININIIDK